jgi:hypothetical protein
MSSVFVTLFLSISFPQDITVQCVSFFKHALSYGLSNSAFNLLKSCRIVSEKIIVWLPPISNQPIELSEMPKREHRDLKDLLESDPFALSVS